MNKHLLNKKNWKLGEISMSNPSETEIRHLMAVLEDAMHRCRNMLKQQRPEEVDLLKDLCYLKHVYFDAEYGLTGVERPEWHELRGGAIDMVSKLLHPLRAFNPELNNWERVVWIAKSGKVLVFIREVLGSNAGANHIPSVFRISLVEM